MFVTTALCNMHYALCIMRFIPVLLKNGDKIYKGLNKVGYLMFSELPREINIF